MRPAPPRYPFRVTLTFGVEGLRLGGPMAPIIPSPPVKEKEKSA